GRKQGKEAGKKAFSDVGDANMELESMAESVDLDAGPDRVWTLIGHFDPSWHPLVANVRMIGSGIGQLRAIETIDGKQIVERLERVDNSHWSYEYSNISGLPVSNYAGTLEVNPRGSGSSVICRAQSLQNDQQDIVVKEIVTALFKTGLESLKPRLGAAR